MREAILLFHFTGMDRRNKLMRALLPLRLRIKEIAEEDFGKPIGYLAGNRDIDSLEDAGRKQEVPGEMLVMAGLSGQRIDQVLKAIRKSGISIPYKAVLTASNQNWNAGELYEELKKEHERMAGI